MNKCKPITPGQIIGGQLGVSVEVYPGGKMYLDVVTFCGRPRTINSVWHVDLDIHASSDTEREFRENGMVGGPDDDRLFKYTAVNRETLGKLVNEQDLVGYLTLIGIQDPKAAAAEYGVGEDEYLDDCDDSRNDDWYDDEDFEGDLLDDDLDSEDDWDEEEALG
jgi:hypothetical protein